MLAEFAAFYNGARPHRTLGLETPLPAVRPTSGPTRAAARQALFEYVEVFYNRQRRYSTLGYLSPAAYEAAHQTAPAAA